MKILALETSTPTCSVALLDGNSLIQRIDTASNQHADILLNRIDALLSEAAIVPQDVDLIAYSKGPGSFTGLRIACSVAQGLAFGWQCPTLGISSLWAIAQQVLSQPHKSGNVYVIADARQAEVYYGIYGYQADHWTPLQEDTVAPIHNLIKPRMTTSYVFAGSACQLHAEALKQHFGIDIEILEKITTPHAEDIAKLAKYKTEQEQNLDEILALPDYIRQRVTC